MRREELDPEGWDQDNHRRSSIVKNLGSQGTGIFNLRKNLTERLKRLVRCNLESPKNDNVDNKGRSGRKQLVGGSLLFPSTIGKKSEEGRRGECLEPSKGQSGERSK